MNTETEENVKRDYSIVIKKDNLLRIFGFGIIIILTIMFFVWGRSPVGVATGAVVSNSLSADLIEGKQEIEMNVGASSWSPNVFVLKKGVPVKWKVNGNQLTGCNSVIIARDFNINIQLKKGENVIEFTPDKEGTFKFSCSMGMFQGRFIVSNDGTATQDQITSATPSKTSGGSCGAGGGCGGCGM